MSEITQILLFLDLLHHFPKVSIYVKEISIHSHIISEQIAVKDKFWTFPFELTLQSFACRSVLTLQRLSV